MLNWFPGGSSNTFFFLKIKQIERCVLNETRKNEFLTILYSVESLFYILVNQIITSSLILNSRTNKQ